MALLLSSWTVVALAGAAWAYQPLARVGPHAVAHGRMLRPWPVRCSECGDESELLDDDELAAAAIAAAVVARSAEAVAASRASASATAEVLKAELAAGAFSAPSATHKDALYKALKKPKGSMALLGEGSPQLGVSLGGYDLNDPTYLSQQFRTAGCSAVCVRVGGQHELTPTAVAETATEQARAALFLCVCRPAPRRAAPSPPAHAAPVPRVPQSHAKGEYPGPLPIVARLDVVEEVQLAKVAADGARAAILSLHLNGPERTKALMQAAASYGLETVPPVTAPYLGRARDSSPPPSLALFLYVPVRARPVRPIASPSWSDPFPSPSLSSCMLLSPPCS